MFSFPKQKLGFLGTIKYSILLWVSKLLPLLLLSVFAGTSSSWPIYLKKLINPAAQMGLFLSAAILLTIISLIPYLSIIANFGTTLRGQTLTLSQSLASGLLRLPAAIVLLMVTLIILGSPIVLGMFFFMKMKLAWLMLILFATFFILSVYLNCGFPLLVIDKCTPFQSIRQSFRLVHKHWWYVAGVVFTISIFTISVENLGRLLFQDIGFIIALCLTLPLQIAGSVIILSQLKLDD